MTIPALAKAMTFIVTKDRDVAKTFYGSTLGFTLTHEDDFAAVFDMNGIMLRLSTVTDHMAQPHTVLGWDVPDVVETVEQLVEKGVVFTIHDGFGQDALGIWKAPGSSTKIAWFKDPDGNVLSVTQF